MPAPQISDSATKDIPTPAALFRGFSRVGLSGFGGVLPWARRLLVETEAWLTAEEFNVLLGLCQFLPGPNVVNLAVAEGSRVKAGQVLGQMDLEELRYRITERSASVESLPEADAQFSVPLNRTQAVQATDCAASVL